MNRLLFAALFSCFSATLWAQDCLDYTDSSAPTFVTPAQDYTAQCDGNGNAAEFLSWVSFSGGAIAVDNCEDLLWTWYFDEAPAEYECGPASYTVIFEVQDQMGNTASDTAMFTIAEPCDCNDCPTDADEDGICDDEDPCVGAVDACGICNGPGAIYECGCANIPAGDCDCDGNQPDAIGVCGGDCAQDLNGDGICDVVGTIEVVLVCPADYVGSDCTANTDASFTGYAVVSAVIGACDSEPEITMSYEDGPINSCGGSYFFERTFYAFVVDFCGNEGSTSCTQFIEVIDNTPPVLNCPPDMTVACDGNGNLEELDAWLASATATNDCGAFEVTNDFSGFDGGCATGSTTVTFTADNCDISTSCSATFTITGTCDCSPCEADADNDGVCDDVDDCVGSLDACGICNGPGAIYDCGCANIPVGDCDCNGNQLDALGDCGGDCVSDTDGDGVCDTDEIAGCTDASACNFDPTATDDDGTCFLPEAGYDCDGNCEDLNGDGVCDIELSGCIDPAACNYDPDAIEPDGSCLYEDALGVCGGDCAADADGDGVCDDLEAQPCGDPAACNFDPAADPTDTATCDYCSCPEWAATESVQLASNVPGYGLRIDLVADHDVDHPEWTALAGMRTYRLYATVPDPTSRVTAVFGSQDEAPLSVNAPAGFYQNAVGSSIASDIHSDLYDGGFPELEYDSWVTIGIDAHSDLLGSVFAEITTLAAPDENWVALFDPGSGQAGSSFAINAFIGGGWLTVPDAANCVPDSTQSVLLAQFTSAGDVDGVLHFQAVTEPETDNAADVLVSVEFSTATLGTSSWVVSEDCPCEGDVDGDGLCEPADACADTTACNYDDPTNAACLYLDACGVCGGEGVPAGDCDCDGNQLDALGVCGGSCAADADDDGICDDVDDCIGELDACGVCNGPGAIYECGCADIPAGDCDCNGNQLDALGVCGGDCAADADGDGLCDDVDDCVGALDACGVCNGPGEVYECGCADIPAGDCDCNGNQLDALGVCGGDCAADADGDGICDDVDDCVGELDVCGVCNGPGAIYDCGCTDIPAGDCDCDGNQLDALGVCGGDCAADTDGDGVCDDVDDCVGELDACGVCNGPGAIYECGCADIPAGYCDCDGNQLDALGVCGGDCVADTDGDGVCDTDEVAGCTDDAACNFDPLATDEDGSCEELDACGVCGGPGAVLECGCSEIPEGDCDCDGTQLDALGVCGGTCAADADGDGVCDDVDDCVGQYDECGVCNGAGEAFQCGCANIPEGDCDCEGNQLDALGVCGGSCEADANANGICDALEASLCGPGTVFDAATGQCVGTGSACPGDFDDSGLVGVSDLLIFLSLIENVCE